MSGIDTERLLGVERTKRALLPSFYSRCHAVMVEEARVLGYAITMHGSFTRDGDFVAVPWTPEAADAETLIEKMVEVVGGFIPSANKRGPELKPHGRKAWSICFVGSPAMLDISVMPLYPKPAHITRGPCMECGNEALLTNGTCGPCIANRKAKRNA